MWQAGAGSVGAPGVPAVRRGAILIVVALAACRTEVQGQLVVVVATNIPVPDEMDAFRVRVTSPENDPAFNHEFRLGAGAGEVKLPADFGVRPRRGDTRRRVTIDVEVRRAGQPRFTTRAITTFLPGRRLRLVMFLAESCLEMADTCKPTETCGPEGCVPPEIDPEDLPDFDPDDPLPDAAVRGVDAGSDAATDASADSGADASADAGADASADSGTDAGPPVLPTFGDPVRVDDLTTPQNEQDPVPSPDGLVMVWERPGDGWRDERDLWVAHRAAVDEPWSDQRVIDELNTVGDDSNAEWLEHDGAWYLYYVSTYHEDDERDDTADILVAGYRPATRDFEPWGPLTSVNVTGVNDKDPSFTADGSVLFFERPVGGMSLEIFEARGEPLDDFVAPGEAVPELSSPDADYDPAISADGLVIVWASDRPPSGQGDLWMALRPDRDSPFGDPVRLPEGEINTADEERDPFLTRDGDLYFSSNRDGDYDVYFCEGVWE